MALVCSNKNSNPECSQLFNTVREASEQQKEFMRDINKEKHDFNQVGQEMTTEEANKSYINQHYPDIETKCNCWPIVFKYQSPEKTMEQLQRDESSKEKGQKRKNFGGNVKKRRGDMAEHKLINMFQIMFRENRIPSFLISGYKWEGHFMQVLNKTMRKKGKRFKRLHTNPGEMDLMIAIPNLCILLVEVKDSGGEAAEPAVNAALTQCARHLDIFSTVLEDVSNKSYIPVISVAALPNARRGTVEKKYCESCLRHIVTQEDLMGREELFRWYQKLISRYSKEIEKSEFSDDIFRTLIERLVGSSSVRQFQTIPEAIQGTVATMNHICYQLPPDQVYNLDKKFLWIRGVPGSGKTLLGLSKADAVINVAPQDSSMQGRDHVLYIINGSSPASDRSCLMQFYKKNFGDGNDICTIYVTESHEMRNDIAEFQIPQLIGRLQSKHKDEILHILLEECQMKLKNVDRKDLKKKWKDSVDEARLGNVWIIQNSFAAKGDSIDPLPDFEIIELDKVMRMSLENINFVNAVLDETYSAGHAIAGKRPVVYRMSCICNTESGDKYYCPKCYHIRLVWLLRTAIKDLKLDTSMEVCLRNAFITSFTEDQLQYFGRFYDALYSPQSYNKLPDKLVPALYFASSIHHFTGCERSHVFVEFDCILQDDFSAMECLTRAVGQMVLLDAGYCREADADNYCRKIRKVKETERICEIYKMEECRIHRAAKEAYMKYCHFKEFEEKQKAEIPPLGGATGQSSPGRVRPYTQMGRTIFPGQAKRDMQMNERIENFPRKSIKELEEDHLDEITRNSAESKMDEVITALKKIADVISSLVEVTRHIYFFLVGLFFLWLFIFFLFLTFWFR